MSFLNPFSRQSGLDELAALDDARLNDIGLTRLDVATARRKGRNGLSYLAKLRNERAAAWKI